VKVSSDEMESVQTGMIFARQEQKRRNNWFIPSILTLPDGKFAGQCPLGNSSAFMKGDILCMKTQQPRF
jgi:hypothetical protein